MYFYRDYGWYPPFYRIHSVVHAVYQLRCYLTSFELYQIFEQHPLTDHDSDDTGSVAPALSSEDNMTTQGELSVAVGCMLYFMSEFHQVVYCSIISIVQSFRCRDGN